MKNFLTLSRHELLRKVGSMKQLASIEPVTFLAGRAKGLHGFDVRNARLRYLVVSDRAMDIGQIEFDGIPMAWVSPVGYSAGTFYEPMGDGWQRNFSGGLLTTCGLTQVGEPCMDGSEQLGLHGRISNTPATHTSYDEYWDEESYILKVSGKVSESVLFGEHLELQRSIVTSYGSHFLRIQDKVVNQGFQEAPFMFLYHINVGFPLVDEHSSIVCAASHVSAWNGTPKANLAEFDKIPSPHPAVNEEVIHLDLAPSSDGYCYCLLVNPVEELAVYLKFHKEQFPRFSLWKGIKEGVYSIGFEPSNCGLNGRVFEKQTGHLQYIKPFEEKMFETELGFFHSMEEILHFKKEKFGDKQ